MDEQKIGERSAKSENLLDKGVSDSRNTYDIKVESNGGSSRYNNSMRNFEEEHNGHDNDEKGDYKNGIGVSRSRDEVSSKLIGREQEVLKSPIDCDSKGSRLSGRMSSLQSDERAKMEGFRRKPQADLEGVRFCTSNYQNGGTSSSYSGVSHDRMEPWKLLKDIDGATRAQLLEQDRVELLRKLDELKEQLTQPCDRMSGFNGNSRQFCAPDKHSIGPSHFNYHQDSFTYKNDHEMAMPTFHPSMHNPNHIPRYGDAYASQMLTRGPSQLPHHILQQPFHPYYPGRFADNNPDSYETYAHNAMLHPHPSSCSCFQCYENKRRFPASVPAPPTAFSNSRFTSTPNDHMLYRNETPVTYGPHVHNSRRTTHQVNFSERQSHTRWPGDFNSEMAGFVQSRFQKIMLASSSRHCRPIAGGSPFITCYNCFQLLQLPKKAMVMMKNHQQNVQCGACSSEISLSLIDDKLIISPHSEIKGISASVADCCVSNSHGHVANDGANLSSDDYSGYDFQSVDKEPILLAADPSLNSSGKSQEMGSFHSSSFSTSEGENSPEVTIAPCDSEVTKPIQQTTKASLSPPPPGSPLKEYFDYSSNNRVVNRFEKGNQSKRTEKEKAKVDKITSRQNSLKEVVLATEMDVHDYSNTGASQDSGDASREHDPPRSNKRGESFIANVIKKSFRDFSRSNDEPEKTSVTINGQPITDKVIKKAEKLSGPIQPGNYWLVCFTIYCNLLFVHGAMSYCNIVKHSNEKLKC